MQHRILKHSTINLKTDKIIVILKLQFNAIAQDFLLLELLLTIIWFL